MAQDPKNVNADDEAAEATYGVSPAEEISEIAGDYLGHNLAKVGGNPVVNAGEKVGASVVIKPADLAFKPKK